MLPWTIIFIGSLTADLTQKTPKIKYGEFPFYLECKVDGEVFIIEDVVVCVYKGKDTGFDTRGLKWEKYIKSTKKRNPILFEDDNTRIYYDVGMEEFYMGIYSTQSEPFMYAHESEDDWKTYTYKNLKYDELSQNKPHIEVIEFIPSKPIENELR